MKFNLADFLNHLNHGLILLQDQVPYQKNDYSQNEDNYADPIDPMHNPQVYIGFFPLFLFSEIIGKHLSEIKNFPDCIFISLMRHNIDENN